MFVVSQRYLKNLSKLIRRSFWLGKCEDIKRYASDTETFINLDANNIFNLLIANYAVSCSVLDGLFF